ncbi:MAG: hypothetical protein ACE15F_09645 [bacterium]
MPTAASYDPQKGEYYIEDTNTNHVLYTKMSGSFTIRATISAVSADGASLNGWGYVFAAQDFNAGSMVYGVGNRVDNSVIDWWGTFTGSGGFQGQPSAMISPTLQDGLVKLVRDGNIISFQYYNPGSQEWVLIKQLEIDLKDPVVVGIGAWCDRSSRVINARFTGVELLSTSNVSEYELYE